MADGRVLWRETVWPGADDGCCGERPCGQEPLLEPAERGLRV